jgi:hypothetical protein
MANREVPMIYKDVEYTVVATTDPSVWKWQFRIDDEDKAGRVKTRLYLLAIRRVQLRIDRELRKVAFPISTVSGR